MDARTTLSKGPLILAVVAVLASAGGAAGYVLGEPDDTGVIDARLAGSRAGEVQGADRGSQEGYDRGFQAGFRHGKVEGYRKVYFKMLAKAGVDVPKLARDGGTVQGGGFD